MIALPWLILLITGDVAPLGLVLAMIGVPRAAFMLVGGAVSDRLSQRTIMLVSGVLRLAMIVALAAIVFSGDVQMWMIYVYALAYGAVSGIFLPAAQSMVPRIVGKDELMIGNTIHRSPASSASSSVRCWRAGSSLISLSTAPVSPAALRLR